MSTIISVHSFRGGTGKSNTTASLAALLALDGKRVGVVDTDIQSPGIHVLFGLDESEANYVLNDYLWGECDIAQAAYDVTPALEASGSGRVFLLPSSLNAADIARVLIARVLIARVQRPLLPASRRSGLLQGKLTLTSAESPGHDRPQPGDR